MSICSLALKSRRYYIFSVEGVLDAPFEFFIKFHETDKETRKKKELRI